MKLTVDTKKFVKLLKFMSKTHNECRLKIFENYIETKFVDTANVSMVDIRIEKDFFNFWGYSEDIKEVFIDKTLNPEERFFEIVFPFYEILNEFIPTIIEDEITIKIHQKSKNNYANMILSLYTESSNVTFSHNINLVRKNARVPNELVNGEMTYLYSIYNEFITMNKKQLTQLTKTITAFKKIGKRIKFKSEKNLLSVISVDKELQENNIVKFVVESNSNEYSYLDVNFLNMQLKTLNPLFKELMFSLKTDYPVTISGKNNELTINYLIAPRIEVN